MRKEESKYWDDVAVNIKGGGKNEITDNIWKRCEIVSRILSHRPVNLSILEIGCGQGLGAAVTNLVTLGNIKYVGTDVSPEFCSFMRRWQLKAVNTDILKLPDGPFHMVWAFDTLEHVRPEDRPEGYKEIDRVLGTPGVILLNIPLDESKHEQEFDWGFSEREVFNLAEATKAHVNKWEPYRVSEISRSYLWVELIR